jgi:hypothetical protein
LAFSCGLGAVNAPGVADANGFDAALFIDGEKTLGAGVL